jgi:hypothetical protein
MDWITPEIPMTGFCKRGDELSGYYTSKEYLGQRNKYESFKEYHVPNSSIQHSPS